MADPLLQYLGHTVTNYDPMAIELTSPTGQITRVARAAAPPDLQALVGQAEAAGVAPLRPQAAPAGGNPYGVITGPGGAIPGGFAGNIDTAGGGAPMTPAAAAPAAPTPPAPTPEEELANREAMIAQLRSMPQTAGGGATVRTTTQTTAPPQAAVQQAQDLGVSADLAGEAAALAREEQAAAEAAGATQLAALAGEQAKRIEAAMADEQADAQEYEQRIGVETQKLQALQQRARTEIDPRRWWKSKGTGEKILAGLAIALGGFGDRLLGRPSGALQIINNAIAQDVDAQLQNREGARADAADQAGFVRLLGDQYADRTQKRQAALIIANELVATQAEQIGQQTASETVRAKAAELAALKREENARLAQQFVLQAAGSVTTQRSVVPGAAQPSAAARAADALEAATYVAFDPTAIVPAAERYTGVPMQAIGGREDARDINKQMAAIESMMVKLQKLKQLGRTPQDKTTAASLYASLLLDAKNVDQAGALDIGAERIMREFLGPNPTDWFQIGRTALPAVEATLRSKVATTLANRAAPVNPATVPMTLRARFAPAGAGGGPRALPETRPLTE
jgi:hypothetical protein